MPPPESLPHKFADILAAYGHALWPCAMYLALAAGVFIALGYAGAGRGLPRWTRLAFLGVVIAAATAEAWTLASLFDDAYISLRYARNLAHGNGLVFNLGERVEGYTNFLWTVLLAGGMKLGLDGPHLAVGGCLAAFVLELLLVSRLSRLLSDDPAKAAFPFATIVLGLNYTFAGYATTGMETMFSALLLTLALERALVKSFALSGLAAVLGMLTHPDFVLFAGGLGLAILVDTETRRSAWRYALPIIVIFTPYFLWRWNYYGDFFPNTYYAKSGNLWYLSQGSVYLLASSLASGLWALAPLALFAMWRRPRHLFTRFMIFGVAPYFVYVAKIGGDFMLGRLLIGVLPIFALLAERGLRELATARWIASVLLAIAVVPVHLIAPGDVRWWLSDERTFYPFSGDAPVAGSTRTLVLTTIAKSGLRPLVGEAMTGRSSYESDLPMVDEFGLTDREVAHQPLEKRGRPGHEKLATAEYLKSRGVMLSFVPLFPGNDLTEVYLNHQAFYLGKYDPALVAVLKTIPGLSVPDLPLVIDEFILSAMKRIPDTFTQNVRFFDEFYFSVNRDPARREAIRELTQRAADSVNGRH